MKVVINNKYGGFGLSIEAVKRLHELGDKHIEETTRKEYFGDNTYDKERHLEMCAIPGVKGKLLFEEHRDGDRSCPLLIQVVEELGEKANGKHAELKVVEIPDSVEFTIEEYDGNEWVAEKHRTWS